MSGISTKEAGEAFFREAASLFPADPVANGRLWVFLRGYLGERVYFRKAPLVYFDRAAKARAAMRACFEAGHLDRTAAIERTMRSAAVSRKVARTLVRAELQTGLWRGVG